MLLLVLVAAGCTSRSEQTTDADVPAGVDRVVLPIDSGRLELATTLCDATRQLVVAEAAFIERGEFGGFDNIDAAATEWKLRLYGLRHAAKNDDTVDPADAGLIHTTTLELGFVDPRTSYNNYLPPSQGLVKAANDLDGVMESLCPTEWEEEVLIGVVAEW